MSLTKLLRQLPPPPISKTRILIRSMSHSVVVNNEQKTFLSSPRFAVVGNFNTTNPFPTRVCHQLRRKLVKRLILLHKVLKWYKAQNKVVTPVDPVYSVLWCDGWSY